MPPTPKTVRRPLRPWPGRNWSQADWGKPDDEISYEMRQPVGSIRNMRRRHGARPMATVDPRVSEVRDDIGKLNLPPDAKAYARRKGLKSMQRQPKDFLKVNKQILNPGISGTFKSRDVVGPVKHMTYSPEAVQVKARRLVDWLVSCV